jgi:catechol 2,3-dioxygenase-like lactoylglutathione lyase family enzyme
MAGPIVSVTVIVPDLAAAIATYRAGVGYDVIREGVVSAEHAIAWGHPGLEQALTCEMRAIGDPRPGTVLLVEAPDARPVAPLRMLGWSGIEMLVADVDAAHERALAAGLDVLCPPVAVGSGGLLRAVQIAGAAGEVLYLTQVDGDPSGFSLPRAVSPVGRVFIAVLTTESLPESRGSILQFTGARQVTDHDLSVRVVNRVHGLPDSTRHRVSTSQLQGDSAIEVDCHNAELHRREPGTLWCGPLSVVVRAPKKPDSPSLARADRSDTRSPSIVPIAGVPGAFIEMQFGTDADG